MNSERIIRFGGDGRIIEVFVTGGGYMAVVSCGDWQRGQSGFRTSREALAWAEAQHAPQDVEAQR